MSRADFRERVKDVVVEMAAPARPAWASPRSTAAAVTSAPRWRPSRPWPSATCRCWSRSVCSSACSAARSSSSAPGGTTTRYLADLITGRHDGLLRDDRDRARLQRAGARHGRDATTRRPQEFVITTPDDASRKDYIGNAAAHAELAVVFAQLEVDGEGHGVHAFVVPIRATARSCAGVRIEDDGLKMGLNGVDNGRHLVRRGPGAARRAAQPVRRGDPRGRATSAPIENPNRRFFTMLGTLVQGRVCVGGAGINAAKVALTIAIRYAVRRRQFEATSADEEELLLDYGMHQRRLFPLLARTYALHFAQEVVAGQLHEVFSGSTDDEQARRMLESRAAGTKALGTWHATRTIQECREACGGAGYLARTGSPRSRPTPTSSPPSRATTTCCCSWSPRACSPTTPASSRTWTSSAWSASSPGWRSRPSSSGRRAQALERIRDLLPGGDEWDQEAGLLDPDYQLAMLRFREEHMLGGVGPPAQARHRRGDEPRRGLLARPGPRHRARPARTSSGWCSRRSSRRSRRWRTATTRSPSTCCATCTRSPPSRPTGPGSWSTAGSPAPRSKAISREVNGLCRKIRPLAVDLVDALRRARRDAAPPGAARVRLARPGSVAGARTRCGPTLPLARRLRAGRSYGVARRHGQ